MDAGWGSGSVMDETSPPTPISANLNPINENNEGHEPRIMTDLRRLRSFYALPVFNP